MSDDSPRTIPAPQPPAFTTRPEIRGTFGAVSSTHWLASQTAMGVLERGGNAFDAAFAAGMVLQVAEPHNCGPAGDAPIMVCRAGDPEPRVICGQGPAPAAATIARFRELELDLVPGTGLLSAAVPGAFDAWCLMLRDYGRMGFTELMEPAITYARKGCPLSFAPVETIAAAAPMIAAHWPGTAAIYLPGGEVPRPGSLYQNPALARSWQRLTEAADAAGGDRVEQVDAARTAWRSGFVADEIDRFCREEPHFDMTGRTNAGLIRGDDLAGWQATYEAPVMLDYHDHWIFKCGPWSQGPVQLQALALLRDFDLAGMDPCGAGFVHLVTEAIKLAFADREAFYGDPDVVHVPLQTLLGDDYNTRRRSLITQSAARGFQPGTIPEAPGHIPDYAAAVARKPAPGVLAGFGGGDPTMGPAAAGPHRGDTCHLDVADRWGNLVAATPSGGWLQSSPVIPQLGFPLGTRLQMCWLDPKSPSALAPGKRPRTTLTPGMAFRNGYPYMAFGTPGGDQQDQWQLVFLLRHLHHRLNLQEAIDAPAFHSDHHPSSFYPRHALPGRLVIESRFGEGVAADLRRRGHDVVEAAPWSEGRLCAVARQDGILRAGANPRGMQGYAVGR